MILFDFSLEAKTRLKVWPDHCEICRVRQPVTHIPVHNIKTNHDWIDKVCARCAVSYATDQAFDLFETHYEATVEYDALREDI